MDDMKFSEALEIVRMAATDNLLASEGFATTDADVLASRDQLSIAVGTLKGLIQNHSQTIDDLPRPIPAMEWLGNLFTIDSDTDPEISKGAIKVCLASASGLLTDPTFSSVNHSYEDARRNMQALSLTRYFIVMYGDIDLQERQINRSKAVDIPSLVDRLVPVERFRKVLQPSIEHEHRNLDVHAAAVAGKANEKDTDPYSDAAHLADHLDGLCVGDRFTVSDNEYMVTDIGKRTLIAVEITDEVRNEPSWLNGPPYAVPECVFDAYDFPAIEPLPRAISKPVVGPKL